MSFHILIGNKSQYVPIENMAMLREGTNFWSSSFVRLSIKVCPLKNNRNKWNLVNSKLQMLNVN